MKFTFAPESTPLTGFRIKRAIDRGGFGEVYYAVTDSGKEVALKLLQRNEQVELRGVTQCLNLKHPNLVPIYDIRTDSDGNHWVVMEYVAGKSLERVLEEHPKGLPLSEVETWLHGIASGISFLHDRGIVHRDLKPANIFREGGHIKIGDVGLCKLITPSRRSAQTESVGTVYYMAPEVAKGRYLSELDIYSLGVIVYEMITGRVPFDGESTGEILMKHLTERPDLSRIPPHLRVAVGRALEKDPQRRPATAVLFAQEFSAALKQPNVRVAATEIPPTHFVDVEQLERQQAAQPQPWSAGSTSARPVSSGGTPIDPSALNSKDFVGAFKSECRRNPWFLVAVIVTATTFLPLLTMGVSRGGVGRVIPGFVVWAAIGYIIYWLVKGRKVANKLAFRAPVPPRPLATPLKGTPVNVRVVSPSPVPPAPPPPAPAPSRKPAVKEKKPKLNHATLRYISGTERTTDIASSMTSATIWSVIVTGIVTAFTHLSGNVPSVLKDPASIGTFGLGTIIASWLILLPSKVWEGRDVDGWGRRLVMLTLGGLAGASAWWLNDTLMVGIRPEGFGRPIFSQVGRFSLVDTAGTASLACFTTYFAVLFGLLRWWLPVDGFRKSRVRVWPIVVSAALAWILPGFIPFNQTWGVCWATAVAAVVQFSAPFVAPERREEWIASRGVVTALPTA